MIKKLKPAGNFLWGQGWIVLLYTSIIWGCNAVAAKLATGEISPMFLVFFRWLIVCTILWPFIRKDFLLNKDILINDWKKLLGMGFSGFTGFSALYYLAAYKTSALNITILQSSMPPMIMLGSWLLFKEKLGILRFLGMMLSITSIIVIGTKGDLNQLIGLSFNYGDLAIILACALYAIYTLSLRNRPKVPAIVFFFGMSISALLSSLVLVCIEIFSGYTYMPTLKGMLVLIFVAFGPTLSAQLAYMRGVELLGPSRASLFPSLVPAFGAIFAVVILNEPFKLYHLIALTLGLSGICLSEMIFKRIKLVSA